MKSVHLYSQWEREARAPRERTPRRAQDAAGRGRGWLQLWQHGSTYFVLFLDTSSIHGLNHLTKFERHPFEISLWLSVIVLSIVGSVVLSSQTWERYQSSPTVVSMDRDMYAWNTTFPCVTVCPRTKLDELKLANYIKNSNAADKEKLEDFVTALSKATFDTFRAVPVYDDIPSDQYLDLLLNLSTSFSPTLTIGASGISLDIVPTITELGLCYSVNSIAAVYNSPRYRSENRWEPLDYHNDTFFVHPLDGEVFAQIINLSTAYDVYIHGPHEIPDVSSKKQSSDSGFYMKLYVTALTVYTAPEAATLSVGQRKCRFPQENVLKHNSVYSYNLCRMECRVKLCLENCGCIPYFYRRIGDEQICDAKGMHCLAKIEDKLFGLHDDDTGEKYCECLPLCDDINYVIQSSILALQNTYQKVITNFFLEEEISVENVLAVGIDGTNVNVGKKGGIIRLLEKLLNIFVKHCIQQVLQEWFLGTNLQWGIVTYPRMRYRRDIIFGFTDVLVYVGSMAGLFLGCSVLSFLELVYFLTLRLFWYVVRLRRNAAAASTTVAR